MASRHRSPAQWFKDHVGRQERPRNPADEINQQATEQPKATKNSRELSIFLEAPVHSVPLSENHSPVNEAHPAIVPTETARGAQVAGSVDEANQETSNVVENLASTSRPTASGATDHDTDDKSPIWSRSMQRFAEEQSELYELMKDRIARFGRESVNNWDTWVNDRPKEPNGGWFRRCKAYLPSFKAVRSVAMALSNLDPHKLAPLITAGVFVAVELCFESVDPSARDKAMNVMLKVKIIIDKWTNAEIDLRGLRGQIFRDDKNLEKIDQIERNLEALYLGCLKLISSVYKAGKTRSGRATSSLISEPAEWEQAYQKLDDRNSECSEWKNQVELAVKRNESNVAILNQIRIRSEDPEPGHQSVKERTGVNDPTSIAGKWFLEIDEFNSWVGEIRHGGTGKRLFWLKGSMGTGKTTLICRIITHFERHPIPGIRFVPYYCYASGTSKETKAPNYETIIRALCRRLAWRSDGSIAKHAKDLFNTRRDEDESFTITSTWEPLLKELIASSKSTVILVIDALDECESMEQYNRLLRFLGDLSRERNGPYCFISSRLHVRVGDYFDALVQFDSAHEEAEHDMKKFITDQIDSKNNSTWAKSIFFESDGIYRRRLENALFTNSGGMFRWVEIWIGIFFPTNQKPIRQGKYAEDLLIELEQLETLDRLAKSQGDESDDSVVNQKYQLQKAYKKLWEINGDEQYMALQISAFQIVMGALESLHPEQLLEAVCLANSGTTITLDELEGLYCNFLKVGSWGRLDFEHQSAKVFVSEMKQESSDKLIFSETECRRALADIVVKAIEQHNHPISRGLDLVAFWEFAKEFSIWAEREWKPDINFSRESFSHFHNSSMLHGLVWLDTLSLFSRYLLEHWTSHFKRCQGDSEFVHSMAQRLGRARSHLESWVFATAELHRKFHRLNEIWNMGHTLFPLRHQGKMVLGVSPFLLMISLELSPFAQDNGPELALLPDFDDDDITLPNVYGCISLHIACALGKSDTVTHLLKFQRAKQRSCASLLEAADNDGKIPMRYASTEDVVKILLDYEMIDTPVQPVDESSHTSRLLESMDKRSNTPLLKITEACSDDFLEWMFKRYSLGPNHRLDDTLIAAASQGKLKAADIFLKHGANINCQDYSGKTPLIIAGSNGDVLMLELLINRGASLDHQASIGVTALNAATENGSIEAVRYLADMGARLDIGEPMYPTALHVAARTGRAKIAQILLEKGADINAIGGPYGTALGTAASWGHLGIVRFLVKRGADVNAVGGHYGTVLGAAAFCGHLHIVRFLVEKGADINAKGGKYGTPLGAALKSRHNKKSDMVDLFLSRGGLLYKKNRAKVRRYSC
ncbi:hypothetical protein F5Y09DRAFT_173588 [Xylaria sp. FL1042]|nr:hypothetical protein F5Y09DRAFT_173588 [Xylaria sp. FL1042]